MRVLSLLLVSTAAILVGNDVAARFAPMQQIPECGLASLYAAMRVLGRDVDLDDLRNTFQQQLARNDLSTVSLAELRQVAESYGLHTAALRDGSRELRDVPLPAILYLRLPRRRAARDAGHFIVLRAVDGDQAEVIDLSARQGWRWVPISGLGQVWHGELLAVATKRVHIPAPWSKHAAVFCVGAGTLAGAFAVGRAICARRSKEQVHASNFAGTTV